MCRMAGQLLTRDIVNLAVDHQPAVFLQGQGVRHASLSAAAGLTTWNGRWRKRGCCTGPDVRHRLHLAC